MMNYAVQKVARDTLLILTTRCFVGETPKRCAFLSRRHAKLNLDLALFRGQAEKLGLENVNDDIARSDRAGGAFPLVVRLAGDQKETLILIRAVKGN